MHPCAPLKAQSEGGSAGIPGCEPWWTGRPEDAHHGPVRRLAAPRIREQGATPCPTVLRCHFLQGWMQRAAHQAKEHSEPAPAPPQAHSGDTRAQGLEGKVRQ